MQMNFRIIIIMKWKTLENLEECRYLDQQLKYHLRTECQFIFVKVNYVINLQRLNNM